jgi:hypothetical protein
MVHMCAPSSDTKAFEAGEITKKWAATAWSKKLAARAKRVSLSDFDRFVVKINKQKVSLAFLVCRLTRNSVPALSTPSTTS